MSLLSDHRLASMAANTMDAIKKKMVAMKGEKDGALDKAVTLEQKVAEQKAINEKVFWSWHRVDTKLRPETSCTAARMSWFIQSLILWLTQIEQVAQSVKDAACKHAALMAWL